ncbi:MAG: hypothetical protein GXP62_17130, partial [Oligoflexia bacterium]|nr:hypothetical protein [Oligoflexia bacterium]
MRFWESGAAMTALIVLGLLLGTALCARAFPALRRVGLPLAIVAGAVGLLLGDQGLGLFTLQTDLLESVVYHGLAIVFIAVGLAAPSAGGRTAGSRAMAFAIVAMMSTQAVVGLGLVLLFSSAMHPGLGMLLPMGFEEGPGQALAMGASWEGTGLQDGAQIGLIIAVLGYAWSVGAGVPLVIWGRRHGWTAAQRQEADSDPPEAAATSSAQAGELGVLTTQVAVLGGCYLLTWTICASLSALLVQTPDLAAMVWGFHFIFGAAIAMAVRPLLAGLPGGTPIDDDLMRGVAGL